MRDSAILAAAVCMVLVAQAPHAQTTPQPQPQAVAQAKAQANLAQAVRAAEQRSGGRARKVELENEKGVEVYEIKTVSKDKSACVLINRVTGDVVRVEGPGFMSGVFDREDQQEDLAELARLEASPLTLAAAIETAEQQTGGRAIGAELRNQYGSSVFEIRVVKDWEMQKVWVDPATSKVIPIPQKPKHDDD